MKLIVSGVLLISSIAVQAEGLSPLPEPLSLQQAFEFAAEADSYDLLAAESAIEYSTSQLQNAESSLGFSAQLELEAAYIEPSELAFDQSSNDSGATLRLKKPLYDFGGSNNNIEAATIEQQALKQNLSYVIAQRKITIAHYYFNVLLADLKYIWDNEALAIAYVRNDALKDRHSLNQISDLELLESENRYLDTLHSRNLSEMQQRTSRAALAEILNRPGQLPSNLQRPNLEFSRQALPDYPEVLEQVVQNNPQIQLAQHQLQAAEQRVQAEDQQFKPLLNAELAVSEYARTKTSDDVRASINLVIPLYESQSIKSRVSKARSAWLKQRSELLNMQSTVRTQALNLWQRIAILQKRHQQLITAQDFRELTLDKSRALYEMEVKTDLGDSMIAISEIQYKRAKNEFELATAWMQLSLLMGQTDVAFIN